MQSTHTDIGSISYTPGSHSIKVIEMMTFATDDSPLLEMIMMAMVFVRHSHGLIRSVNNMTGEDIHEKHVMSQQKGQHHTIYLVNVKLTKWCHKRPISALPINICPEC